MGGQLTISELAIMVTLGAIVSPAMQIPQLGVMMGVMILICALIFQRGINFVEFKSTRFEKMSQGRSGMVVKDGVILLKEMAKSKISQQQLFSALRGKKIYNLGEIGRVYFEACGIFSIYKRDEPEPGLQIFPPGDKAINGFAQEVVDHARACSVCGNVKYDTNEAESCSNCNATGWILAAKSIKSQSEN